LHLQTENKKENKVGKNETNKGMLIVEH